MAPASRSESPAGYAPPLPPGWQLHAFDSIDSTNRMARTLAEAGAPEGQVVWAGEQLSGRARRGRAWHSPRGNLYCSVLLRPCCSPAVAGQLSFVVALAMADAVEAVAPGLPDLHLKWPNDLVVGRRKLAGILLESSAAADGSVDWLVAGTGVNLDSHPEDVDYPATDLAAEVGIAVSPVTLLERYAKALGDWLGRWRAEGFGPLREAWMARAAGVGETIAVRLERETVTGRFATLDEDGALHLILGDGGRRRIAAGDVYFGEG